MKQNQVQQKEIRLGTHGEDYGSWMSNPVFYVVGALLALSVVLAVLSFTVFHITGLGGGVVVSPGILLALLLLSLLHLSQPPRPLYISLSGLFF